MDRSATLQTDLIPIYTCSFKDSHGIMWILECIFYGRLGEFFSLFRKDLFSQRDVIWLSETSRLIFAGFFVEKVEALSTDHLGFKSCFSALLIVQPGVSYLTS